MTYSQIEQYLQQATHLLCVYMSVLVQTVIINSGPIKLQEPLEITCTSLLRGTVFPAALMCLVIMRSTRIGISVRSLSPARFHNSLGGDG